MGPKEIPQVLAWASLPIDDVKQEAVAWGKGVIDRLASLGTIPHQADVIAEQQFPGSARDSSTKNAFRHALGTGMLTQQLGGGPLAAAAAKGVGYLWEGLGAQRLLEDPTYRQDSLHDLNANALGAATATQVSDRQALIDSLKQLADASRKETPPAAWQSSPGYMTRSVK